MKRIVAIVFVLVLFGCSEDQELLNGTLEAAAEDLEVVRGNVIACAASDVMGQSTLVFLYPRPGATNIRYFETASLDADKDDFSQYNEFLINTEDVFNGYLKRIETSVEEGKWVIVSFEEEGMMHLCNPIRIKKDSKPTEYLPENVSIQDLDTLSPTFTWSDGSYDDTIIYFQVVNDARNDLLSGTYTSERMFQYYNTENVILNVTRDEPPELTKDDFYGFTLMGVSEDNWVNLFAEIPFRLHMN
ncbi:MAG: hypothetical protein AAFX53_19170 [Bacteroidota bacterium]